jgi:hypothetical protein
MNNLNSKRFIITLVALIIFTGLVYLKFDIMLVASALGIIITPFITSETFKAMKKEG